jgi:hypothetical protein
MAENIIMERGIGSWEFCLYNPIPNQKLGPFFGILQISKDFHIVVDDQDRTLCLGIVPSPNVAYVVNKDVISDVVSETANKKATK